MSTSSSTRHRLERTIGKACLEAAKEWDQATHLQHDSTSLPVIADASVTPPLWVAALLGRGAFCEIRAVECNHQAMAAKQIHSSKASSPLIHEDATPAAIHLVLEAKLLHALQPHPHIVSFYGVSCQQADLASSYARGSRFRVYMERLDGGTVADKIRLWRLSLDRRFGARSLLQRLDSVALPVAQVMAYLHSKNILYRDLKVRGLQWRRDLSNLAASVLRLDSNL